MEATQLRDLIERTLKEADKQMKWGARLYSNEAVELLMLTCAVESNMGRYIRQLGGGPALGIFQMEPATEKDIWDNYLSYREDMVMKIDILDEADQRGYCDDLEWNLKYAIIMARLHYYRVSDPLPTLDTIGYEKDFARYWKEHYNTRLGKGDVNEAVDKYHKLLLG